MYGKGSRVAADGSDAVEVSLWRRRRAAEGKLAEAQKALAAGEAGAEDYVEEAERELDDLLDQALEGGGWDAGDEFETFEEEEEGSEQGAGGASESCAGWCETTWPIHSTIFMPRCRGAR